MSRKRMPMAAEHCPQCGSDCVLIPQERSRWCLDCDWEWLEGDGERPMPEQEA